MKAIFALLTLGCLIGTGTAQKSFMTATDYKKYWEGKTFKAHTPAQPTKAGEGKRDWLQCQACKLSVSSFDAYITTRSNEQIVEDFAIYLCDFFIAKDVCHGAVTEMGDILIESLAEGIFEPDYFCGNFLGYCTSTNYYVFYSEDWVNRLLDTKPEYLKKNDFINKIYDQIAADPLPRKTLTAVQISDPHVDYEYTVGSDSKCGGFLCCRASNGFPTDPSRQAGPFGSYQCDLPASSLDSMLEFVKTEVKPDLFFWTGDNSPHNIWANNITEVGNATLNITLAIQRAFDGTNISVYPIQGNHDTWPVNI